MKNVFAALALAAALAVPHMAMAEAAATAAVAPAEVAPNTGALSLSGGVDFVTAYIFRGYVIEKDGFIAQPYATLSLKAYEEDGIAITPFVGIWNSLQSQTDANASHGPSDSDWFETDVYGGVDLTLGNFTLTPFYTFYTYPGDAYQTTEELNIKLAYDDAAMMTDMGSPVTFSPYVLYAIETKDDNGTEDQYFELGITPAYSVPDTKLTLSVPMSVGLSVKDYYLDSSGNNDVFGYASAGLAASYALPVPARFGSWALNGGVYYYYLASDSVKVSNDGDDSIVMAKVGLSFTY